MVYIKINNDKPINNGVCSFATAAKTNDQTLQLDSYTNNVKGSGIVQDRFNDTSYYSA